MPKYIDVETEGYHPLRDSLTEDDWDRLDRYFLDKDDSVEITTEEAEAYEDYIFYCLATQVQTVYGVTIVRSL